MFCALAVQADKHRGLFPCFHDVFCALYTDNQQHKDIDPNKSVYQVISGGNDLLRMGGRDINADIRLLRERSPRLRCGGI